jgi:GNAT superfamily N-acetyltransferase
MKPVESGGSVEVRGLSAPTRAEIEQLAELFDLYRVHYGEAADASRTASWLEANIDSGRLEAFVADDNGVLVGFAVTMSVPASLRLGHFWQIRDLFVLPSHRRRGVGRKLLDVVREAAIRAGALRLVIQTEADNDPALRLYVASGYTTVEGYCSLALPLTPDFGES